MENYYSLLGITETATPKEIKKAFRENAKKIHPDIAGEKAAEKMRKLISAYKILSDNERRNEYNRVLKRLSRKFGFDYRAFLHEKEDKESRAKLILFELFQLEEDEAVSIWEKEGGLDFPMEKYLDREDWMDCAFVLAEELASRERCMEALMLLIRVLKEERKKPYFKIFSEDIEILIKDLARRMKTAAGRFNSADSFREGRLYLECMASLLGLGFSSRDEAKWLFSMGEILLQMGENSAAIKIFKDAKILDPGISLPKKKLKSCTEL